MKDFRMEDIRVPNRRDEEIPTHSVIRVESEQTKQKILQDTRQRGKTTKKETDIRFSTATRDTRRMK